MSRSRHQHKTSITNGFTPGGFIPAGYSYLERSHSLVTPTRRSVPKGMASPRIEGGSADLSSHWSPSPSALRHSGSLPNVEAVKEQHANPAVSHTRKDSIESLPGAVARSEPDVQNIADLVAYLPSDPKVWTPSQVALYLTHVLGLTPKLIVEDVTAYVRNARMGGRTFLRLREKELAAEGLNLKWRKLMIEAVKRLRRDCVRNRIWDTESAAAWSRQEEDLDGPEETAPPVHVSAHSKGTLKRLRDKKAVRGIITSFENFSEYNHSVDDDDGFVALGGLHKRSSVTSLHSHSSNGSPRPPMAPIFGEGYVRERAASFSSLNNDGGMPRERQPAFSREQLEQWFGDLSEREAEALADELDADDFQYRRTVNRSTSDSSVHSSISAESVPMTPSVVEVGGFDLSPIDVDTVNSIVKGLAAEDSETCHKEESKQPVKYVEPLHKDILLDDSEDIVALMAALPRPGSGNGSKSNPYRQSTYEPEEVEALGLEDGSNTFKFDTAKKLPPRASDELGAANDSVKLRKSTNVPITDFRDIFASENEERGSVKAANVDRREHSECSADEVPPLVAGRTVGTFGRAALAAALKVQSIETGEAIDGGRRAEDESEWGVTFSRKASRRNTLARSEKVPDATPAPNSEGKESTIASRMSELFNPAPLSAANLQRHDKDGQDASRSTPMEVSESKDKILLPLTTLEPDEAGKGSLRKTSMVLVDRRRFEALAKRMGVLEEQLASLEAISLPPDSDLGSLGKHSQQQSRARAALDDVFTIPPAPLQHEEQNAQAEDASVTREENWNLVRSFGAIPSYGE